MRVFGNGSRKRLPVELPPALLSTSSLPPRRPSCGQAREKTPSLPLPQRGTVFQHVARAPRRSLKKARIGVAVGKSGYGSALDLLACRGDATGAKRPLAKRRGNTTHILPPSRQSPAIHFADVALATYNRALRDFGRDYPDLMLRCVEEF
jgi:hypothetical protein